MRVLIIAIGTTGDVAPFLALGAAFRRRGHRVTVAGPEPFRDAARRADLDFESLVDQADYAHVYDDPTLWRPILGARRMFAALPLTLDPVHRVIERWANGAPPFVVASTLAIGARLTFDLLGGHLVTVHLSPSALQTRHEAISLPGFPLPKRLPAWLRWEIAMGVDDYVVNPAVLPALNAVRERLGLSRVKRLRHWWNSPQKVAAMFPSWFQPAMPDWPQRTEQFGFPNAAAYGGGAAELAPDLIGFLRSGPPPVVVTFGSTPDPGAALHAAAIEACRRHGQRCLILSRRELGVARGEDPALRVASYAPLDLVLPHARAVVHHGGVGTAAQAFAAGLPQIVAPLAFDQFDNARRIEALGCGVAVRRGFRVGPRMARALRRVLSDDGFAADAGLMAARMKGVDALAGLCDAIERLAREPGVKRRRNAPPFPYGLAERHLRLRLPDRPSAGETPARGTGGPDVDSRSPQ